MKLFSDMLDTVIVGWGFQVKNDLASAGDPHVSSFTVAVYDKTNPREPTARTLLTVCEVPYFTGNQDLVDDAKRIYVKADTSMKASDIKQALEQNADAQRDFIPIREFRYAGCKLLAKRNSTKLNRAIVLRWLTIPETRETFGNDLPASYVDVYYDAHFTNIQVVAHPFKFDYLVAVMGDYRLPQTMSEPKRFSAPYTIRFPRGTLRNDKRAAEADSVSALDDVHGIHPQQALRNLRDSLTKGASINIGTIPNPDSEYFKTLRQVLKVANAKVIENANDDTLKAAVAHISDKWPTSFGNRTTTTLPALAASDAAPLPSDDDSLARRIAQAPQDSAGGSSSGGGANHGEADDVDVDDDIDSGNDDNRIEWHNLDDFEDDTDFSYIPSAAPAQKVVEWQSIVTPLLQRLDTARANVGMIIRMVETARNRQHATLPANVQAFTHIPLLPMQNQ
eukprot:3799549-Rhodomonas_salina.2